MIYSLLGEHNEYSTHGVIVFQTVVAFVSWIAFALAVAGRINGRRMRWLLFVTVASGMFSRGYLTFDSYFLSDSLSLSFLLVWLAILVSPFLLMDLVRRWFGRSWLVAFLIIIGLLTAMTASARDANILLIVCCTPIAMPRLYVAENIVESWPIMFDQILGAKFRFNDPLSMFQFAKLLSVTDWIEIRLFVLGSVVLLIATLFFVRGGWSDFVLSLGVLLALAGFSNAVIGFHGDLWEVSEMGRHAWIGSTFLRIGAAIVVLLSLQMLTGRFRPSLPSS